MVDDADLDDDSDEFDVEPPDELVGDDPDATAGREALFVRAELPEPKLTVTGFVWNESSNPRPAAVPKMTNGARFIGGRAR